MTDNPMAKEGSNRTFTGLEYRGWKLHVEFDLEDDNRKAVYWATTEGPYQDSRRDIDWSPYAHIQFEDFARMVRLGFPPGKQTGQSLYDLELVNNVRAMEVSGYSGDGYEVCGMPARALLATILLAGITNKENLRNGLDRISLRGAIHTADAILMAAEDDTQ